MQLGANYSFSRRDQLRQGKNSIYDILGQKTESHIISTFANIGVTNQVSVSISLPLIINRSVNLNLDKRETNVGDISLLIRHFSSPRIFSKPTNIQLSIGSAIPTGNGIANVITDEKNFASGTFDPIISVMAAIMIQPGWSFDARFYTRQILSYDDDRTKIGNLYTYGFNVTYAPIGSSYNLNAQAKFINRGQDIFNNITFQNSGGDYLYFTPGFSLRIVGQGESAVRFWSEVDIPLYQYVQGIQLTEKWNMRLGVNFGFTLFGHKANPNSNSFLDKL